MLVEWFQTFGIDPVWWTVQGLAAWRSVCISSS
jgi:hypothetical protein